MAALGVAVCGLACEAPTPSPVAAVAGPEAPARVDAWRPGPARSTDPARDPAARLVQNEACVRCHPTAAHQWADSQHATAWDSDAFARAFEVEPRRFCQRCHAPEEDPRAASGQVTTAAASMGVACVTCHVPQGSTDVWAAPHADPHQIVASAPHRVVRTSAFGGPQACAGCHEFAFPDDGLREQALAMQSTITEHAASAAAARSCADCHMPKDEGGARSHAFPGAYDGATLARALAIEAARPDPTTVRLSLRPAWVGHAVPTGDLLRRIEVQVVVDGPDGSPAFATRRHYGRRFGPVRQTNGITVRGELEDRRIGVGPGDGTRVATVTLPDALADAPVRWRVVHQRVAHGSANPRAAVVEGEIEFAHGVL